MDGGRRRRAASLIGCAAIALLLAGCSLFFPGFGDFEELPEMDEDPTVAYTSGAATIEIDGSTVDLDRLAAGSGEWEGFGANATWRNADGWILQVSGAIDGEDAAPFGFGGYLVLHRIADGQHWTTLDPTRCVVTIARVDDDGLEGTATCRGMSWIDAIGNEFLVQPDPVEGEDEFDAEITFEAGPGAQES